MHVVTFYSYKGGTGRSMALVNVAIDLVRSGQRVLIVDFDLEAPGLDTFNLPKPKHPSKGLVEFVHEYQATNEVPDLAHFIYSCPLASLEGKLWVMPAGIPDDDYDARFQSIDWQDLYENRHGFLVFEDLKAQWNKALEPDYVLIDSRTGHTDIAGICTRQLPDAVVLFMFPNEQNRRGLSTIVQQIRNEAAIDSQRQIKLHFVMSNVPELDDEEGFLADTVMRIKSTMAMDEFSGVIHHYPSLDLLAQTVFTLDRPRTRLAEEYRQLSRVMRRDNLRDRAAALEYLNELAPVPRPRRSATKDLDSALQEIRKYHSGDSEVLMRLAILLRKQRRFQQALDVLKESGDQSSAAFLLMRAELISGLRQHSQEAVASLSRLLQAFDATSDELMAGARLLAQLAPERLSGIVTSSAFLRLDIEEKVSIASHLMDFREALQTVSLILEQVLNENELDSTLRANIQVDLSLALIGQGEFQRAIQQIGTHEAALDLRPLDIQNAFNYAMASWGSSGSPSSELFQKVIELDRIEAARGPNGNQCLAIALWAVNRTDEGLLRLNEARQQIVTRLWEFSAWSYLRVPTNVFMADLREIQRLIEGAPLIPRFMKK
jgi:MinD-like ATPase involved in chromosome partitioning or flagellar assembly